MSAENYPSLPPGPAPTPAPASPTESPSPNVAPPASQVKTPLLSKTVSPRSVRRTFFVLGLMVLAVVFSFAGAPSGFGLLRPGPVVHLEGAITGSAAQYPPPVATSSSDSASGWFAFTTVEVVELSYKELLFSALRGDSVSRLADTDSLSPARAQMRESIESASRLALARAFGSSLSPNGLLIVSVLPASPASAAGVLPGDVVLAVDGAPLLDPLDLRRLVEENPEGLTLMVERLGSREFLKVYPRSGKVGVLATGSYESALAGVLEIETGSVGGSSAGLMMTLAALDAMFPGDLTSGFKVAGTGTIEADGSVGPVSGADLKMQAALEAGAEWFLLPSSLLAEIAVPASLHIQPVDSVDDALDLLCGAGSSDEFCAYRAGDGSR